MSKVCAVLPAAGRGTRLGLSTPKLLAPIGPHNTVWSILRDKLINLVDHIHIIASPHGEPILKNKLRFDIDSGIVSLSIQPQPLGMGDAIFCGYPIWSNATTLLVIWADQVSVSTTTLQRTLSAHAHQEKTVTLPLTQMDRPYVEYIFENDRLIKINQTREGDRCNTTGLADVGVFALSTQTLLSEWMLYLEKAPRGLHTHEINFLPFLPFLSSRHWQIQSVSAETVAEARGINTPEDLLFFQSIYAEAQS